MDIPIELFLGGMGISIALAIFGFLRQPQIPAMLCFGGMFMLVFAVATDNIIMDSFASGNNEDIVSYDVTSHTGSLGMSSTGTALARAIFASASNSAIVGDTIDCIDIFLSKTLSPTGTATIGTLDATGNIITSFGTIDVGTQVTSAFQKFTFCLPSGQTHTIASGDRIGVRFTGGDATNFLTLRADGNNPFDGTVTFLQSYVVSWTSSTGNDITAKLYLRASGFEITQDPYAFTELPKTLFALMGSIFMLCGALMVLRNN